MIAALTTRRGALTAGLLVLLALLPVLAQAYGSTYAITLASRVVIYAIVAVSLDLILGYGGLVSFGHAAYFGLGGYVVAILSFHLAEGVPILGFEGSNEALVTLPLAMLASGLAALMFGALSLRTSGIYFIMITLAFAQMLFYIFVALKYYGGDDGLSMPRRNLFAGQRLVDPASFYYLCFGVLLAVLGVLQVITRSRFGMVLAGAKANERRMAALGFPVMRYRLAAFVIAGMIAGLGGGLWANLGRFVSPDMMAWVKSGEFMLMVILGGVSSLVGPVIGAAAFIVIESTISGLTQHWQAIFGPIVILIALYAPRGLWGGIAGERRP